MHLICPCSWSVLIDLSLANELILQNSNGPCKMTKSLNRAEAVFDALQNHFKDLKSDEKDEIKKKVGNN
jgi:tryptophan 2,3-dioxygenase